MYCESPEELAESPLSLLQECLTHVIEIPSHLFPWEWLWVGVVKEREPGGGKRDGDGGERDGEGGERVSQGGSQERCGVMESELEEGEGGNQDQRPRARSPVGS